MIGSAIARLLVRPFRYGPRRAGRKRLAAAIGLGLAMASPVAADPVTIAALGDSLTQGYGLAQGEGLVPQLQDWLAAHGAGDVTLVNAGVSGDTTAGGLARIDWTLTDEVDALIVALGGNDLLRGIDPAVSRQNLDGILIRAGARDLPVLLIGIRATGNYGPDYKAAFDAIFPDLAKAHDTLLFPDIFDPLLPDSPERRAKLMQPDGIHPNARGVALIVDAIGPSVLELVRRISPAP